MTSSKNIPLLQVARIHTRKDGVVGETYGFPTYLATCFKAVYEALC